jgi:hypothetical protein
LHNFIYKNRDLGGAEDAVFGAVTATKDFGHSVRCAPRRFLDWFVERWIEKLAFRAEHFDTVRS